MERYRFKGRQPENLAGYGMVQPNEIITVDADFAAGLERCGSDSYEPVLDDEDGEGDDGANSVESVPAAEDQVPAVVAEDTGPTVEGEEAKPQQDANPAEVESTKPSEGKKTRKPKVG